MGSRSKPTFDEKYLLKEASPELIDKCIEHFSFDMPAGVEDIPERFYTIARWLAEGVKFEFKEDEEEKLSIAMVGPNVCNTRYYDLHLERHDFGGEPISGTKWFGSFYAAKGEDTTVAMARCFYMRNRDNVDEERKQDYDCSYKVCPMRFAAYIAWRLAQGQEKELKKERKAYLKKKLEIDTQSRFASYLDVNWSPIAMAQSVHLTKDEIMSTLEYLDKGESWLINVVQDGIRKTKLMYDRSYCDKGCLGFGKYENDIEPFHDKDKLVIDASSNQMQRFSSCCWESCINSVFCEQKYASYVDSLIQTHALDRYMELQQTWFADLKCKKEELLKRYPELVQLTESLQANNFFYGAIVGNSPAAVSEIAEMLAGLSVEKELVSPRIAHRSMLELALDMTEVYSSGQTVYGKDKIGTLPLNQVFIVSDIGTFVHEMCDEKNQHQSACKNLVDLLSHMRHHTYVLLTGTPEELRILFERQPVLKEVFKLNTFELPDLMASEIYQIFNDQLSKDIKKVLPENFEEKFIEYVAVNKERLPFKNEELAYYLVQHVTDDPKHRLPREFAATEESIEEKLDALVGIDDLKKTLIEMKDYQKSKKLLAAKGISLPDSNNHMLFYGNPGTGKTTIARIVAQLLYEVGVLNTNKVMEVSRQDFIAKYLGQTALKTQELIDTAMGGVLFIDEAYSLAMGRDAGSADPYGLEAISTLIKAMEDHKGEFVVIFAGYRKELEQFVQQNSGIRSRIGYSFLFPDFTVDELGEILVRQVERATYSITDEALEKAKEDFGYFRSSQAFGNGRFVEHLLQRAFMKQTKRDVSSTVLEAEDIPDIEEILKTEFDGENMINPIEVTDVEKRRVAIHELGHAIVRKVLVGSSNIKEISIEEKADGTMGCVVYKPESKYVQTAEVLEARLASLLSGKNAEDILLGSHSSGCSSDISQARQLAKDMVYEYAMGDYLEEDADIKLLKAAEEKSRTCLEEHRGEIEELVDQLLEKKIIKEEDIDDFFEGKSSKTRKAENS